MQRKEEECLLRKEEEFLLRKEEEFLLSEVDLSTYIKPSLRKP